MTTDLTLQLCNALALLALSVGLPFIAKLHLKRFEKHFEEQGRNGLAITFSILSKEFYYLLVLLLLTVALRTFSLPEEYKSILLIVLDVLFWIVLGRVLYKWVEVPIASLKKSAVEQKSNLNLMVIPVVRSGLRFLIVAIVVLEIIQIVSSKSISSLIAGIGIGGVALALASQNALSHLVGSLVIFIDRPFQLGERIIVDQWDGKVERVGMRSTRIRTGDDEIVTIPNGDLANKAIKNAGRRSFIKKLIRLNLARQTSPEKLTEALNILKALIAEHPYLNPSHPPRVFVEQMGEYSIDIVIHYWFFNMDYWKFMEFNDQLHQAIISQFVERQITLALPNRTVQMMPESASIAGASAPAPGQRAKGPLESRIGADGV